jgi:hypothetical protein
LQDSLIRISEKFFEIESRGKIRDYQIIDLRNKTNYAIRDIEKCSFESLLLHLEFLKLKVVPYLEELRQLEKESDRYSMDFEIPNAVRFGLEDMLYLKNG